MIARPQDSADAFAYSTRTKKVKLKANQKHCNVCGGFGAICPALDRLKLCEQCKGRGVINYTRNKDE